MSVSLALGTWASVMARNLIKAGHTLGVYNRTRSRAERSCNRLGRNGRRHTRRSRDPRQTHSSQWLLTTHAVEDVIFGPGNVIESLPARRHSHFDEHNGRGTFAPAGEGASGAKQQHYVAAPVFRPPRPLRQPKFSLWPQGRGADCTLPMSIRRHGAKDVCGWWTKRRCKPG